MPSLAGQRIVVTRAAHQAEQLAAPLRERGAEVLLVPLIEIAPPSDPGPLRQAAAQWNQYDWIIFTSANAVSAFSGELRHPRILPRAQFAAIGSATRDAAGASGFAVTLVSREYVAESLLESFAEYPLQGKRILIPSAAVTRDVVPDALRQMGALVDVVEAYRNVIPPGARERIAEVFRHPFPDWTTFASPSAVANAVALAGPDALRETKIASIGPVTSDALRKHRLEIAAEAVPHTVAGLVAAMERPAP